MSGRGFVTGPGGRTDLEPGACLLIRGGLAYDFVRTSTEPFVHYWTHFDYVDPRTQQKLPHAAIDLPRFHRHVPPGTLLYGLLDRVTREMSPTVSRRPDRAGQWFAAALLEVSLHDRNDPESPVIDESARWIDVLCSRVRTNPGRPYRVSALAEEFGYEPAYFSRLFKKRVGVSPKSFVTNVRMDAARSLLLESAMSVKAIAKATGYHDSHFFSRHFAAANGVGPSAYRQGKAVPPRPR